MNYYLLKTDAFSDTFSIVEAGRKISLEYTSAIQNAAMGKVSEGDKVFGYNVMEGVAKTLFTIEKVTSEGKLILYKDIDFSKGTPISQDKIGNITANNIVEISEAEFNEIYQSLVDQITRNANGLTRLPNCLEVKRKPRTTKVHPLNFIIYGAPGTGKTYSTAEYALAIIENRTVDLSKKTDEERKSVMEKYKKCIRNGQIVFTTFHQSYGYEEFIQGLRPDTKADRMTFKTVDGVFKHIADIALNDSDRNYVIIIDEINRANISKVFGELITLIEEDKRWGEVNETCATLQSGDIFAVPNNLYIVGTMNSADKSISLIDTALRRRFEFIEQRPNADLIENLHMRTVFQKINEKLVTELDSSDLLIGHSYFMNKTERELTQVINNSIIPLLYEYFYDNKRKVASVIDYSIKGMNVEVVQSNVGRLSIKQKEN